MNTEEQTAKTLSKLLREHGVKAEFVTTYTGPTVTQFAYSLESGTRLRQLTSIQEDLALAVGLESIRIVAPIPGTALVGLEVPRTDRETVEYAAFTQDEENATEGMALPFPIGVDISNTPIWADLTKLPHLLIAGATGSGKSVALSAMLTYLIENNTPDELQMWLVDPKRVELSAFAEAPQVKRTVTNMADATDLLADVESEMDRRYSLFEESGVKNIKEFNDEQALDDQKLPYHVVAIDEMADLIMTNGKAVEPLIVRIAQLARAAGIHMVLATQRPTVNVVTGLIKNNVPSRWAFAVQGNKDSMVILDQPGAETLLGAGDSLWLPAGAQKPTRAQSVWADEAAVSDVVEEAVATYTDFEPTTLGQEDSNDETVLTEADLFGEEPEEDEISDEELEAYMEKMNAEPVIPDDADVWYPVDCSPFEDTVDIKEFVKDTDRVVKDIGQFLNYPPAGVVESAPMTLEDVGRAVAQAMEARETDRKIERVVRRQTWIRGTKTVLKFMFVAGIGFAVLLAIIGSL